MKGFLGGRGQRETGEGSEGGPVERLGVEEVGFPEGFGRGGDGGSGGPPGNDLGEGRTALERERVAKCLKVRRQELERPSVAENPTLVEGDERRREDRTHLIA